MSEKLLGRLQAGLLAPSLPASRMDDSLGSLITVKKTMTTVKKVSWEKSVTSMAKI